MAANFNTVDIKPDLKKAVKGFGSFKVALATVLPFKVVLDLATFFEYPPVDIEELSNAASAGLFMVHYMEERGQIEPTSIRTLLCALKKIRLFGIEMRVRKLYEEHTGRLCSSDDQFNAQLEGFGSFKVALATVLPVKIVLDLATFLEYPPIVIEELSNAASAGLLMIRYMEERGQIEPTSIRTLLCALKKIHLFGIEMRVRKLYEEHTGRLCSSDDQFNAQLEEKQSVASSASSSTAKSPPSQKGDGTDILFISFSSKNEEMVTELVSKIESVVGHGSCWTYLEKNLPGDNLPENIVNAINKADIVLCMITQEYIDSEPCEKEFLLAKKLNKHIIPLHLEKVLVPYKKENGNNSPMQLDATNLVYARMYTDNLERELFKVIAKIKKCLHGKDTNASGCQ